MNKTPLEIYSDIVTMPHIVLNSSLTMPYDFLSLSAIYDNIFQPNPDVIEHISTLELARHYNYLYRNSNLSTNIFPFQGSIYNTAALRRIIQLENEVDSVFDLWGTISDEVNRQLTKEEVREIVQAANIYKEVTQAIPCNSIYLDIPVYKLPNDNSTAVAIYNNVALKGHCDCGYSYETIARSYLMLYTAGKIPVDQFPYDSLNYSTKELERICNAADWCDDYNEIEQYINTQYGFSITSVEMENIIKVIHIYQTIKKLDKLDKGESTNMKERNLPNCAIPMEKTGAAAKDTVTAMRTLANTIADTYARKNADYGDSFGKSVSKYGIVAALTRMSDKWNRLENLLLQEAQGKSDAKVKDEAIEDTLLDLATYCLMTVVARRK